MPVDIKSSFFLFAVFNAFSLLLFLVYKIAYKDNRAAINVYILANGVLCCQWIMYAFRGIVAENWIIIISNGLSFLGILYSLYGIYLANESFNLRYFIIATAIAIVCTLAYALFIGGADNIRIAVYSFVSSIYILIGSIVFLRKGKENSLYGFFSILTFALFGAFAYRGFEALSLNSINLYSPFISNKITLVIYLLLSFSSAIFILLIMKEEDRKILKHDNELLDKLNSTNNKIMSVLAHDLRNHFNAILGFTNILKDDNVNLNSKEGKMYINILNEQAEDTNNLLESLLSWARTQTKQFQYYPEFIPLNETIINLIDSLKNLAALKGITLMEEVPTGTNIYADKNMLNTIIRNLISNSIKFTPKKGIIKVKVSEHTDYLKFEVQDNGIGINKNEVDKLFNINTNRSTRGTNNEKGTGLGLLLCKDFVEKHGGTIWVESEPNVGSTFLFTIPKNTVNKLVN